MIRYDTSTSSRRLPEHRPRRKFIPYPALWNALHGEPELREALKAMDFDGMTEMARLQATEGTEAARAKLRLIATAPDQKNREEPHADGE